MTANNSDQRQKQTVYSALGGDHLPQKQNPGSQTQHNINGKIDAGRFLPEEKVKGPAKGDRLSTRNDLDWISYLPP